MPVLNLCLVNNVPDDASIVQKDVPSEVASKVIV